MAFVLLPEPISWVFFHEPEVIPVSVSYFVVVGLSEPFMCVELMAIGTLAGLGRTKLCSAISIVFTAVRIPLAYVLSTGGLGLNGIWWALTLTSMAKGVVLHLLFRRTIRTVELEI